MFLNQRFGEPETNETNMNHLAHKETSCHGPAISGNTLSDFGQP